MDKPQEPPVSAQSVGPPMTGRCDPLADRVMMLLQGGHRAAACQTVLDELGPDLCGYLRGMSDNDDDGDDLYQQVLSTIVWQRLQDFQRRSLLRTWLYAIAHHLLQKRWARYSYRKRVFLDTGGWERELWERAPASPCMESLQDQAARRNVIARLRQSLTPEERELLILATEREFSFGEIAQIMKITQATAKQRYHRLKEKLRVLAAGPRRGGPGHGQ